MCFNTYAQLGFCPGNSGDPIFVETFGAGTGSVGIPSGSTTYQLSSGGAPNDGFYTVSNNTDWFGWHVIPDHTGDPNGRMLIVNAAFTAGEFFSIPVSGLCENTSYEFSSWMINLLPPSRCNGGIPINVRFEIWDSTNTDLLKSGDTGAINGTSSPNWDQYALTFQTKPGQTSVILKMLNNGVGGCGNDLALDDIVFRTCGDRVVIEDPAVNTNVYLCENEVPFSTQLTARPDFSIFSTHFYQWQESSNGIVWNDIPMATNATYNTPNISSQTFYRVKVAEDVINLSSNLCSSTSEIFEIGIIPFPAAPVSNGDLTICENDPTPLSVNVPSGVIVNWYDAPTGGTPFLSGSASYKPTSSGVYYAEAETTTAGCRSTTRARLQIDYLEVPEVIDESLSFCENTITTLRPNVINPSVVTAYRWNTGETTETIDVSNEGTYTVDVFNGTCFETKTITLSQINNPEIENIDSDGSDIVITTSNTGDFIYSLNGNIFQSSNVFSGIEGGLYTIYVKERNCSEIITEQFLHFYVPKFFTPNNDGNNDVFDLKGIEFFSSSYVSIFDRYGKLLKNSRNSPFSWNGTFKNQPLPTGDYWYVIVIDNQKITGHFTLKR
ncbi:T9SS type B sorting domain-containing protein [Flavivirga eckloniae]|uniref:Ig-like domain-containing protein n=1 Tax=Flavivirga eckloniae TaxID=1803846 RepID=A0A2K9PRG7_9FLAO|nr:T9SS type B sorting domain-containing protein [Flavivirga eckloniae]AUP79635.1 hypothetical protein C1H87_13325 [Flavivirga eckloniae]